MTASTLTLTSFTYVDVDGNYRCQGTVMPLYSDVKHLGLRTGEVVKRFERSRIVDMKSTVIFNPTKQQVIMFMGHEEEGYWS